MDSAACRLPAGRGFDLTVTGVVRSSGPHPATVQGVSTWRNDLPTPASGGPTGRRWPSVRGGRREASGCAAALADLDAFTAAVRALPGGAGPRSRSARRPWMSPAGRAGDASSGVSPAGLRRAHRRSPPPVVGQSIARQVQLDAADQPGAPGARHDPRSRWSPSPWSRWVIGAGGALLAVAWPCWPRRWPGRPGPAGRDRPGLSADVPVLALGGDGCAGGRAGPGRHRRGGSPGPPARPPAGRPGGPPGGRPDARAGATPSAVTGFAWPWSPGAAAAAPVRTAMVGVAVGGRGRRRVACLRRQPGRLVHSPALQGWNWDVAVGNPNDDLDFRPMGELLARNPLVGGYTLFEQPVQPLILAGATVPRYGCARSRGACCRACSTAARPRSADEIALGRGRCAGSAGASATPCRSRAPAGGGRSDRRRGPGSRGLQRA